MQTGIFKYLSSTSESLLHPNRILKKIRNKEIPLYLQELSDKFILLNTISICIRPELK